MADCVKQFAVRVFFCLKQYPDNALFLLNYKNPLLSHIIPLK